MALRYQMETQDAEESEWATMVNRIDRLEARCERLGRDLDRRLTAMEQTLQQILTAMHHIGRPAPFKAAPAAKATCKAPPAKAESF